jgi:hypothetical protein
MITVTLTHFLSAPTSIECDEEVGADAVSFIRWLSIMNILFEEWKPLVNCSRSSIAVGALPALGFFRYF